MIVVTFISLQLTLPLRFWVRSVSQDTELRMRTLTLNRHEVGISENKKIIKSPFVEVLSLTLMPIY